MIHFIVSPYPPAPVCLSQLPCTILPLYLPLLQAPRSILWLSGSWPGFRLFPGPFPTHTGPCRSLPHSAQRLLAISSQTPQLVSSKRESPISLTMHLSPFLPTALCTVFSCPSCLPLLLETDHLAASFWLLLSPTEP